MEFKDVFSDALRYPFTDVKKLLTLFILLLGSILIFPAILAYGYLFRIIDHTLHGSDKMPDFKDVRKLLEQGIMFIAASIIYLIPTTIILVILLSQKTSFYGISSPIWTSLTIILVGFLIHIVSIIALTNMVYEKRFTAAFSFGRIFEIIEQIGWKKYLAYLVVFTLIMESLTLLIKLPSLIHLTGYLVFLRTIMITVLINSYILIFNSRFKGLIYPNKLETSE